MVSLPNLTSCLDVANLFVVTIYIKIRYIKFIVLMLHPYFAGKDMLNQTAWELVIIVHLIVWLDLGEPHVAGLPNPNVGILRLDRLLAIDVLKFWGLLPTKAPFRIQPLKPKKNVGPLSSDFPDAASSYRDEFLNFYWLELRMLLEPATYQQFHIDLWVWQPRLCPVRSRFGPLNLWQEKTSAIAQPIWLELRVSQTAITQGRLRWMPDVCFWLSTWSQLVKIDMSVSGLCKHCTTFHNSITFNMIVKNLNSAVNCSSRASPPSNKRFFFSHQVGSKFLWFLLSIWVPNSYGMGHQIHAFTNKANVLTRKT